MLIKLTLPPIIEHLPILGRKLPVWTCHSILFVIGMAVVHVLSSWKWKQIARANPCENLKSLNDLEFNFLSFPPLHLSRPFQIIMWVTIVKEENLDKIGINSKDPIVSPCYIVAASAQSCDAAHEVEAKHTTQHHCTHSRRITLAILFFTAHKNWHTLYIFSRVATLFHFQMIFPQSSI